MREASPRQTRCLREAVAQGGGVKLLRPLQFDTRNAAHFLELCIERRKARLRTCGTRDADAGPTSWRLSSAAKSFASMSASERGSREGGPASHFRFSSFDRGTLSSSVLIRTTVIESSRWK